MAVLKRCLPAVVCLLFVVCPGTLQAANPLAYRPITHQRTANNKINRGNKALSGMLWFYDNFLSVADGNRCPSFPSCSSYARQAIRRHGSLLGILMTVDRLIHEHSEVKQGRMIMLKDGKRLIDDTLRMNDFWLSKDPVSRNMGSRS